MSFFKRNWAYFLVILIILIFIIQIILYYATFKNFDFGWNTFTGLADKDWLTKDKDGNIIDDGLEGKWGAFGDFIGGILNPILGFITIILLLIAHNKDKNRDEKYHNQREIDLFLSRLENLKLRQSNYIQDIRMIKKTENGEFEDYVVLGSMFFSVFFNVLNRIYVEIKDEVLSDEDSFKIAYLVVYYGIDGYCLSISRSYCNLIGSERLREITDIVREDIEDVYGLLLFNGFRTQLSSYFRGLYHIMGVIENTMLISEKEKYELSKDIRVQMSPQEQIILLANSLTENGEKWNEKGYCIFFKLFRNVNTKEYFEDLDLKEIVYNKIDKYIAVDTNRNKLEKYQFKDQDLEEFKRNYFERI